MAATGPAREAKVVFVTIKPGQAPKLDPVEFRISKSGNDQVKWVTDPAARFTVEFTNGSPFYEKQFNNEFPYSGLVRREVLADPQKAYKYVVHGENWKIDPTGIIDP